MLDNEGVQIRMRQQTCVSRQAPKEEAMQTSPKCSSSFHSIGESSE